MKYAIYARKSKESKNRQILSIPAQIHELKLLARRHKIKPVFIVSESMSARHTGRPVFTNLIERIRNGEINGILAWHPDRLARNALDGGQVIHLLDTEQLSDLKFVTSSFENTPQGKLMLHLSLGQSKYYVDSLSENVRRGLRQKIRAGVWPGLAPLGYLNDPHTHTIIPDPVKAPLVRKLFLRYAKGRSSYAQLIIAAKSWGLTTSRGKVISKSSLSRIFHQSFYCGEMLVRGSTHKGIHKPLIAKSVFNQTQKILNYHRN